MDTNPMKTLKGLLHSKSMTANCARQTSPMQTLRRETCGYRILQKTHEPATDMSGRANTAESTMGMDS